MSKKGSAKKEFANRNSAFDVERIERMNKNKMIRIKMFGMVAEKTGHGMMDIPYTDNTEQLIALLYKKYPLLEGVKFALAINKKITPGNSLLKDGDEVALLPPFSGG